eukprot:4196473-Prymnesium_polylepis.2
MTPHLARRPRRVGEVGVVRRRRRRALGIGDRRAVGDVAELRALLSSRCCVGLHRRQHCGRRRRHRRRGGGCGCGRGRGRRCGRPRVELRLQHLDLLVGQSVGQLHRRLHLLDVRLGLGRLGRLRLGLRLRLGQR